VKSLLVETYATLKETFVEIFSLSFSSTQVKYSIVYLSSGAYKSLFLTCTLVGICERKYIAQADTDRVLIEYKRILWSKIEINALKIRRCQLLLKGAVGE